VERVEGRGASSEGDAIVSPPSTSMAECRSEDLRGSDDNPNGNESERRSDRCYHLVQIVAVVDAGNPGRVGRTRMNEGSEGKKKGDKDKRTGTEPLPTAGI